MSMCVSGRGSLRAAALGQLVDEGAFRALERQLRERPLDFTPHAPDRDTEDALAALQKINHLVG